MIFRFPTTNTNPLFADLCNILLVPKIDCTEKIIYKLGLKYFFGTESKTMKLKVNKFLLDVIKYLTIIMKLIICQ